MITKYFHIVLAVGILLAVSNGFSESFPNRPTAYELQGLVVSGTQCAKGMNERCWATQYSTNPVTYRVAPFTNTAGLYLDQSLMGTMATKIRSLVPYYVNTNTVYDGTTDITMLTVAGLWADLGIGDGVNQFTRTFASGTNGVVYGDSPWRICQGNLDERYNVLNAMEKRLLLQFVGGETNFTGFANIHEAQFYGETEGMGNLYYTYFSGDLGPDGQGYTICLDGRILGGGGGSDYISLGQAGGGWSLHNGQGSVGIYLDSGTGDEEADFYASLTFANNNALEVVNCWHTGGYGASGISVSYSTWEAEVSATLDTEVEGVAAFEIYPVLTFPFDYCK